MKAHKYWSVRTLITMIGTFILDIEDPNQVIGILRYSTLICMIMSMYIDIK